MTKRGILETKRLILREFLESDVDAVQSYACDPEVTKFMEWGPNSIDDTRVFVKRTMEFAKENPRHFFELAITLKDTGELIGAAGIRLRDISNKSGDLGYTLNKKFWGKGFATEVAQALLQFGVDHFKLHRIWATCAPDNVASAKVLQKIGMEKEGYLRHDKMIRGKWRDTLLFAKIIV